MSIGHSSFDSGMTHKFLHDGKGDSISYQFRAKAMSKRMWPCRLDTRSPADPLAQVLEVVAVFNIREKLFALTVEDFLTGLIDRNRTEFSAFAEDINKTVVDIFAAEIGKFGCPHSAHREELQNIQFSLILTGSEKLIIFCVGKDSLSRRQFGQFAEFLTGVFDVVKFVQPPAKSPDYNNIGIDAGIADIERLYEIFYIFTTDEIYIIWQKLAELLYNSAIFGFCIIGTPIFNIPQPLANSVLARHPCRLLDGTKNHSHTPHLNAEAKRYFVDNDLTILRRYGQAIQVRYFTIFTNECQDRELPEFRIREKLIRRQYVKDMLPRL